MCPEGASVPDQDHLSTIRRLLDQERIAHFARDPDLLVATFADGLINISTGRITRSTRDESRARFQAYFDRSEFLAWDDLEPPVIRISADGSMAYAIVRKLVRLRSIDADGRHEEEEMVFAWMEAWQREGERWLLQAVASTSAPTDRTDDR